MNTPRVDAFIIQGINDTLFNGNEAVWNYNCLREAGNDAYLLMSDGGHVLPGLQIGQIGSVAARVRCGAQDYQVADLAYGFLDGKLRKLQQRIEMPRVCFTQGNEHGVIGDEVMRGGQRFATQSGSLLVGPPSIDLVLNLLRKLDPATLSDVLSRVSADAVRVLLGALSGIGSGSPDQVSKILTELVTTLPPHLIAELGTAPRFVPLYQASGEQTLAGIPWQTSKWKVSASWIRACSSALA